MEKQEERRLNNTYLGDCFPDQAFRIYNGGTVRNLYELADSIEHMSEESFTYHVNKKNKKNDFAVWIKNIIGDIKLANKLKKIYKKKKYLLIIRERIHELEFDVKSPMKKEDKIILVFSVASLLIILFTSFFDPMFSSRLAVILVVLFIVYKLLKN